MEERYILMQFTGLTDQRGKDIFEGDIVEARNVYHSTRENKLRHEVVYVQGGFMGMSVRKYDIMGKGKRWCELAFTRNSFETREIEIIGNIYENPELLGVAQKGR